MEKVLNMYDITMIEKGSHEFHLVPKPNIVLFFDIPRTEDWTSTPLIMMGRIWAGNVPGKVSNSLNIFRSFSVMPQLPRGYYETHVDEVLKMPRRKCSWQFLVLDEQPDSIGSESDTEVPQTVSEGRCGRICIRVEEKSCGFRARNASLTARVQSAKTYCPDTS